MKILLDPTPTRTLEILPELTERSPSTPNRKDEIKKVELQNESEKIVQSEVYFETSQQNLNDMEEEIQPEISQAQTPPVAEKNKKSGPKEVVLQVGDKNKRPAPKVPTKEEMGKTATELENYTERSPLKMRNLRKVEDKPKKQTPKSGWL